MVHETLWKRFGAVLVAGALVLGAAACGGGGEKAEVVDESTEETTDRSAERSTEEAEREGRDDTTDGSLGADLDELSQALEGQGLDGLGECMEIGVAYMAVSFGALGAMFGGGEALADMQRDLDELKSELPSEIRDDFAVIADAFADFAKDLEGFSGNFMDPEYQQQMEDAGAALETPEVTKAQENIEAYLQKECPDFSGNLADPG